MEQVIKVHSRNSRRLQRPGGELPVFEILEGRLLLSAVLAPFQEVAPMAAGAAIEMSPNVTNRTPVGLTPTQLRHAYGFDQVTFVNSLGQTIKGDGTGQTIAIVDAYDDPNIANDLRLFDSTFGISSNDGTGVFTLTEHEMASRVSASSGWALEIALDVEWAHAMAPGAHLLLVEARSSYTSDLLSAVNYARSQSGVVAVSMSWGGSEFSTESLYDSYFTTPTGHVGGSGLKGGVTFLASSGDSGAPPEWPSVSPNIVSVGGTTLNVNSAGTWLSETGWTYSGGGISLYESKPGYQVGVTQSATRRTNPDVAYNADVATGVGVYDSYGYGRQSGWFQVGGTSAGAPQWAALFAIADQGRALAGKGSLDGLSQSLPAIYSLPATDFHDILVGNNGYPAGAGYDLVTGRGSPFANRVVSDLLGVASLVKTAVATSTGSPLGTKAGAKLELSETPVASATLVLAPTVQTPAATFESRVLPAFQVANADVNAGLSELIGQPTINDRPITDVTSAGPSTSLLKEFGLDAAGLDLLSGVTPQYAFAV